MTPMIDLSNGRVVLVIRSTLLFREEILREKDVSLVRQAGRQIDRAWVAAL